MTETQNEVIVHAFIEAYNAFDVDSMLAVLAPDIRFTNISGGAVNARACGRSEFEQLARRSAKMFRTRTQRVRSMRAEGSSVIVEIDFEAVPAVDLPGGPVAGEKISLKGRSRFTLAGGLIESIVDES